MEKKKSKVAWYIYGAITIAVSLFIIVYFVYNAVKNSDPIYLSKECVQNFIKYSINYNDSAEIYYPNYFFRGGNIETVSDYDTMGNMTITKVKLTNKTPKVDTCLVSASNLVKINGKLISHPVTFTVVVKTASDKEAVIYSSRGLIKLPAETVKILNKSGFNTNIMSDDDIAGEMKDIKLFMLYVKQNGITEFTGNEWTEFLKALCDYQNQQGQGRPTVWMGEI